MKMRSLATYISFGDYLNSIRNWRTGIPVARAISDIDHYLFYLDMYSLPITSKTSAYSDLRFLKEELLSKDKTHALTEYEARTLAGYFSDIEKTLYAEMTDKYVYEVTDKRIDVNKLLYNIDALFPSGVFKNLPGIAKYDFTEAGKCIAFNLPTAAAFHILRGTEEILRQLHFAYIGNKQERPLWRPMIEQLNKLGPPPDSMLLKHLEYICEAFRNPTDHPDKIYSIDEAQDLFCLCTEAISRMVQEIAKAKKEPKAIPK